MVLLIPDSNLRPSSYESNILLTELLERKLNLKLRGKHGISLLIPKGNIGILVEFVTGRLQV